MNPLVLLAALGTPSAAPPTSPAPPTAAFALVTSGGVSLGSYQAGFLYLTTELRKRAGLDPLVLVTGASAGSANALIAGLQGCSPPIDDPTQSLGWRVWIPVGFDDLWVPEAATPTGFFSSRAMEGAFAKVEEALAQGLPEACDFVAGFTTTRLEPFEVELAPGLRIPRQEEAFAVRVRGRGAGRPAWVSSYVDPYRDVPLPVLPLRGDAGPVDGPEARADYAALASVLFASASFPLAFAPKAVPHCLTQPPGRRRVDRLEVRCETPERTDRFIDGGVFDNNPLRLAYEITRRGLRRGEDGPVWRDLRDSAWTDERPRFDDVYYAYVDPWLTAYPPEPRAEEERGDTISFALGLAERFIATARAKELYSVAEQRDRLDGSMVLSRSHYPTASDLLYAFFGFFEEDFRIFDFYLGMYDAWQLVRERMTGARLPVALDGPGASVDAPWRPFACLLGWLEPGREALRSACAGDTLRNFRVLLQLSVERLHVACARVRPDALALPAPHAGCEAAARGEPAPWILDPADARPPRSALRTVNEVLDRLAELRFAYRDRGLPAEDAGRARTLIRRDLEAIASRVAGLQQDDGSRELIGIGGRLLANQLEYESPLWLVPILVGSTLEAGLLFAPLDRARGWLRLNVALQVDNWTSVVSSEPFHLRFAAVAGPEVLIRPWTGPVLQPSIGLRAGVQLSTWDGLGADRCRARAGLDDARACTQAVLQGLVALGVLDRLRLQVLVEGFPQDVPAPRPGEPRLEELRLDVQFMGGVTLF